MPDKPTYEELERSDSNHKHCKDQLIHSHDLMDYIISHARSAIAVHDRDLKYIYVSKRYLDEYKVEEQNVIGKHHYEVFPDLPQKWRDVHQRSLAGEVLSADEDPYYREDGSVEWTRWECRPWYEADGSIGGIIIYTEVITERKKMEKALQISEERLDLAIKGAGIGLWDWNIQTGETVFNERWAEIVGYTLEELSPVNVKTWIDFCHPDDLEKSNKLLEEHFAGKTDYYLCEARMKHKDGHWVWVLDRGKVCEWSENGKPLRVTGTHIDITERKQAEETLRINEQRLQLALEGADLGMWDWNMQTNDVYFSPRYLSMLGYGPTELPHTLATWENLLHPDDRELAKQQTLTSIKKGSDKWGIEFRLRHKDGQYLWISGRGKIVEFSQDGLPIRAAGTHRDITNRKIAEEKLIDREELFREIFNNMGSAVAIYNAVEDGDDFIFKDINRAGLLSSQVGLHEIVGKKVTEIFPSIKDMGLLDVFHRVYETGIPEYFPGSFYQDDRITLWVENYVCKIPSGEIVVVYDDITEQKKMEEELLKGRKLEAVGVLAGGIAHDFNNILAAILGNISLALTNTDPKDETYELLEEAEKASLRAKDLTHQLLTFSKGGEPVKKIAAIDEVIRNSANFVLRGSNVRCDCVFSKDLSPVEIDSGQISQVIQNLVLNANQAMPTGGIIEIDCINYKCGSSDMVPVKPGNYIKITIKDNGVGIPKDLLGNIFDPYFTTKQKGSGLGLAITHSIISKHGGVITVDSEPGRGTTFTIYLPASSQGRLEPEQKDAIVSSETAYGRIMIMDDEEMIRKLVHRMLSRRGYEVVSAENGEKAVQLYQEAAASGRPIDLIVMDLTIPGGMGGKDAVKEIHKINPEAKVIVSSGYSNDPVMANFSESGFYAALVKPFQMRELMEVVGKAVSS